MMHETWTNQLSAYLDDELPREERLALDEHLETCADCRAVAEDLRDLQRAARELTPRSPERDLWPAIVAQIDTPAARRVSFSLPAAMAAGLFIALASGIATWTVIHRPAAQAPVAVGPIAAPAMTTIALETNTYDRAVDELLVVLQARRHSLNPRTVEAIERSLALIDAAIGDARAALDRDPGDIALASYLADRHRAKLAVLRQVERFTPAAP